MASSTVAITRPAHARSMTLLAWGGLALAGGLLGLSIAQIPAYTPITMTSIADHNRPD